MEDEDQGASSILQNFSILAEGILAIWEGEDSVRRRIEVLLERQQAMKDKIRGAEKVQIELRQRLSVLEQGAQAEQASLQHLKQERLHALAQGMKHCTRGHGSLSPAGSTEPVKHHCLYASNKKPHPDVGAGSPEGVQHDANLVASAFSTRQTVAFEMLEFAHERLTSYMWAHMCERVRSMQTPEDRGEYLRIFRGVEGRSAFGMKPLSEATYAELLDFSLKKRDEEKELEVEATLEAAERRLVEEACKVGFGGSISDIRMQALVYLQCRRHFKSHQQRRIALGMCVSQPDIIFHMLNTAQLGQLGVLQPASQLIQIACFFLSRA